MPFATIDWRDGVVRILDQTFLPLEVRYRDLSTVEEVAEAIRSLRVRGAPAIGIAGAFGVVVGLAPLRGAGGEAFYRRLEEAIALLRETRPTAVNLSWGLERLRQKAQSLRERQTGEVWKALEAEALAILEEDRVMCRRMGEEGAKLLPSAGAVLTYCNTGGLAAGGLGTALAAVYTAREQGKRIEVYACETRPLLQGSRLTAWELQEAGVPVTVICDNMAAVVLRDRGIACVLVGADRVARNGDIANKIGTYGLALLAREHGVPFYVVAPFSSIDLALPSGKEIPIEERDPREVAEGLGQRVLPPGVGVFNPAFDVTPRRLVMALVTDRGVVSPVTEEGIAELARRGLRA